MPKRTGAGLVADPLAPEWRSLYQEHAPRIRRIATYRVGPNLADEVVQDTFLRAYRNRQSFDASLSIRAWLNVIALRASIDALRHKMASIEVLLGDAREEAVADNGEAAFFNDIRRQGINETLAGLNDRYRRVLERVVIDGWTHEEVAAAEGISTKAVKSLLSRARNAFKDGYTAFSERSGVFGGAAVGTAILRLRTRVQRFVEHHAGAVTTALTTVAVVGIAAVPTTHPLPTRAVEAPSPMAPSAPIEHSPSSPSIAGDDAALEVRTTMSTGSTNQSAAPTPSPDATAGGSGHAGFSAATTVGRDGQGAGAVFYGQDTVGPADSRTYAGITVSDCDANAGTELECRVIDVLTQAP